MHFLKTGPGLADLLKLNWLVGFWWGFFHWFSFLVWGLFFLIRHYLELGDQRTNLHVANTGGGRGGEEDKKKPQQEVFTNIYAEVQRKGRERLKISPARKQQSVQ